MPNITNTDSQSFKQKTEAVSGANQDTLRHSAESMSESELILSADELAPYEQELSRTTNGDMSTAALPLSGDSVPLPASQNKRLFAIANTMAQAKDLENLYQITVTQLRKHFSVDRALIYQFQSTTQGTVIAESLTSGYTPSLGQAMAALAFGEATTHQYQQQVVITIEDIAEDAATPHQVQLFQRFQVQASVSLPIFLKDQLWGLLVIQNCTAPRQWKDSEIEQLYQVGTELTLRLQTHELYKQSQQESIRERLITGLVKNVRELSDIQQVFESTTRTIRQYLQSDRVAIFQFHPDTGHGSGQVVAESVNSDFVSAKEVHVEDHCFGGNMAEAYRQGRFWAAADIYELDLPECHINILAQFQVRANLVVPLIKSGQLWGLFCIHQCRSPRSWQESEITFVQRVAAQLDVALQQTTYLEQVQSQNRQLEQVATQERLITKIADRLRQNTDLQQTLKVTVHDIRQLLQTDRVGLFQFDVDKNYSVGKFVVEDVAAGVLSALSTQVQDHCFAEDQAENYRKGRYWVVNDIHELDLPDCLTDLLSQLQVKASLVVPLLKGDILWGLFCIHECRGPRQWQKTEVEFAHRIGAQLNLALQQADYLEQLHEKNIALETTASREKDSKERLQQQVIKLLSDVRPALDGDLTVRAPITDTEVGTVASAYNTTLQSLQRIVLEVKQAADQVGQTSQQSETSVSLLKQQAQQQAESLRQTLQQVKKMISSTEDVVSDAQQVEAAVQQANQTVKIGDAAIDHTVGSIMSIRTTVAETNQRIKRLSESSQKISKVVSLISHFTNQTQLLALNASIEATRAGEYGQGFSVVADEVRSLARQSATAATEIEQLVQDIQVNTAEVSTAMETGIQQVAEGTNLVTSTREHLTDIVKVTEQISHLIKGITKTTDKHATEFKDIAGTVDEATEIAYQTSTSSEELAQSINQLLFTAEALQKNTDKFKVN